MTRSRLATVKEKRELRQALVLISITITLLIGFIFWGLPELAKLVGNVLIKQDGAASNVGVEIKPAMPILSDVPEATNSAELAVTGFAQPGVEITLYLSALEQGKVIVSDAGAFLFPDIKLDDGENRLSAVAYNPTSKLESDMSREHIVSVDTKKPEVVITSPENQSVRHTEQERIVTIAGTVNEEGAKVYVGERIAIVSPDLSFSLSYQLIEGDQEIVIKAIDLAGNESLQTLKLRWEK